MAKTKSKFYEPGWKKVATLFTMKQLSNTLMDINTRIYHVKVLTGESDIVRGFVGVVWNVYTKEK